MKRDIENRDDLIQLVNLFYERVKEDDEISIFFTDTVHVNWEQHLPKMYDFWEHVLWGTGSYYGHPMLPHFQLNDKFPLQNQHFEHWKSLFFETVDELFEGQQAENMKMRAFSIAGIMESKMRMVQQMAGS